jgi:hypothetical protein
MTARNSFGLALAAISLLAACTTTTYVRIRHPLQVGGVDPHSVPFDNTREERRRQLPNGVLVDEAQLLTLTPDQICVRVSVWGDQLTPQRADFNAYRIALVSDHDGVENTSAQIQLEQGTTNAYHGVRRQARYTGGTVPVRAVATPFVWQITQQPAVLCFPNGGFVTPSTTHLTLELNDAGSRNRINFEWDFDSSVAATPE